MKRSSSPSGERQSTKYRKKDSRSDFGDLEEIQLSKVNPHSKNSFKFFKAQVILKRPSQSVSASYQVESDETPCSCKANLVIDLTYKEDFSYHDISPGDWLQVALSNVNFEPINPSTSSSTLPWVLHLVDNWRIKVIKSFKRKDLEGRIVYGIEGKCSQSF